MKLPRFKLRTLFVLIALAAIPLGWVAYQLNWIRQRHQFVYVEGIQVCDLSPRGEKVPPAPVSLRLFGEEGIYWVKAPPALTDRAKQLFPEADIILPDYRY